MVRETGEMILVASVVVGTVVSVAVVALALTKPDFFLNTSRYAPVATHR